MLEFARRMTERLDRRDDGVPDELVDTVWPCWVRHIAFLLSFVAFH